MTDIAKEIQQSAWALTCALQAAVEQLPAEVRYHACAHACMSNFGAAVFVLHDAAASRIYIEVMRDTLLKVEAKLGLITPGGVH